MSKVNRYNAIGDCARSDTGDFVEFEDYSALIVERDGLKAARIAYASEFPLGKDGTPDVGSIHQNIRKLKAERDWLRDDAQRYWWLRDNCEIDATSCDVVKLEFPLGPEVEGFDMLDEAIDAARSAP